MTRLLAARALPLLAAFGEAGVLAPADVHVAQRLGVLLGEADERVLLAVALTVRSTRQGSVVFDLDTAADLVAPDSDDAADLDVDLPWPELEAWVAACAASPLVTGSSGGPPLHQVGTRLWLDRYWKQEVEVADDLLRRSADRPTDVDPAALRADLDELFAGTDSDDQRLAVATAALSRVAVIAGGPGTGKTTTVAQLIAVLRRRLGADVRIALAAPTGKAAARLEEAVRAAGARMPAADADAVSGVSASTLHRLLGWRPNASSRFRHDRDNHLPVDVVIVDESSMVSLTLMARLLEALPVASRLVLVGDPDQLASVEAGAVLGDLVDTDDIGPVTDGFRATLEAATVVTAGSRAPERAAALRESVAMLRTVHRFDAGGPIAELAELVRTGDADGALALLRAAPEGLRFIEAADDEPVPAAGLAAVHAAITGHERSAIAAARDGDVVAALDVLETHRVLCAHRGGPRGVRHWTELAERWLAGDLDTSARIDGHYAGQPLLVTENDYETGLYNGDTGIVVRQGDDLVAAFRRGGNPDVLPLVRLGDVRPLHAMTVHRAQGSQFDTVTVLLPLAASPLATRQTFYTAITRARRGVLLVGSAESIRRSVETPIARATGLRDRLAAPLVAVDQ